MSDYIKDMREEAAIRRAWAAETTGDGYRVYLLERAAFFDQCADDAEAERAPLNPHHPTRPEVATPP